MNKHPWLSVLDELDLAVDAVEGLSSMESQLIESGEFAIPRSTIIPLHRTVIERLKNARDSLRNASAELEQDSPEAN